MALPSRENCRSALNESIIKQLYYVAYIRGCKLPRCLGTHSTYAKVGVRGDGCTAVDNRSDTQETVLPVVLRTDNPIPVCCSVYYFEVTINVKSRSGSLAVGICSSRSSLNEWPGMEINSYGYHSNNGAIYHGAKELTSPGPSYGEADVIGCGVNFVTNSIFFTKNGVFMGPISAGKKLPHPVHPCISLACPSCHVSANFGQHKFTFDIGQYIARERAVVISMAVDRKCNDQLAYLTMRNLISSYLLHHGYLETAQALGSWVTKAADANPDTSTGNESPNTDQTSKKSDSSSGTNTVNSAPPDTDKTSTQSLPTGPSSSDSRANGKVGDKQSTDELQRAFNWPEAVESLLRRRQLRNTIKAGDYLSALEQLETHFTNLSEQDPSIAFVLRCHHFIDLICNQHDASCYSKISNSTSHRNVSQSFTGTDGVHRGAQKRSKPSSSLESSPDNHMNGHSHLNGVTNGRFPSRCNQLFSDSSQGQETHTNGNHRGHEHSPSSCQAPIRLRLETAEDESHSSPLPSSAPIPIFPVHHHCCGEDEIRCSNNSVSSNSLDEGGGLVTQVSNGVLQVSRPHFPEGSKRERLVGNNIALITCPSSGLEVGGGGVGVLDPSVGDQSSIGNVGAVGRSKCLAVLRRTKQNAAPNPPSVYPTSASENMYYPTSLPSLVGDLSSSKSEPNSGPAVTNGDASSHRDSATEHVGNGVSHISINLTLSGGCVAASAPAQSSAAPITATHPSGEAASGSGTSGDLAIIPPVSSYIPSDWSTKDVLNLVEYGRMLRATAVELKNKNALTPMQIQLLNGAFGMIAYQDPYSSPFRKFLEPAHRERLADAVNSAIMVHLNQPACPVLDSAIAFLERALIEDEDAAVRTVRFCSVNTATDRMGSREGRSSEDRVLGECRTSPGESDRTRSTLVGTSTRVVDAQTSNRPELSERPSSAASNSSASSPLRTVIYERIGTRPVVTDTQSFGTSEAFCETTNGTTVLPRPMSASVVSSSLYIPPSALVSFHSRVRSAIRTSSPTLRVRPTSLQPAGSQLRRPLSSRDQATTPLTPSFPLTPSTPVVSAVVGWPTSSESNPPSSAPVRHSPQSLSSRLAVASYLTNTHAPTGPELAGFFHPILFID
ncbi:unnamed protein product [Calicophoron daubneyi]|uniref:Uncharacterized protein n=1 Tax=Calicophoron daubneyi TaxID=300641 RepID=A0AAV2TSS2_CALDB